MGFGDGVEFGFEVRNVGGEGLGEEDIYDSDPETEDAAMDNDGLFFSAGF